MFSSENKSSSIGHALFDVGVQLSVPTVISTASAATKLRAFSSNDQINGIKSCRSRSPSTKTRHSLNSNLAPVSCQTDLFKPKIVRDVATQSSPINSNNDYNQQRPNQLNLILDRNNNPTAGSSSISETSKEYLTIPRHRSTSKSPISSPTRHGSLLKNTLIGLWQGLNSDQLKSASSSPVEQKFFEDRVRLTTNPSWIAFTKVVTSLLTFTKTKNEKYQWIQLVGHPGTFKEGINDGFVLKQSTEHERRCCQLIRDDILRDFVPRFNGSIKDDEGKSYIEIEDLLSTFHDPCIMDCKIGVRTYLEEDLEKSERDPEPRPDLYEKMILIDPKAPTEEEHQQKKVLKPRYMIWRENLSSSESLGFRIEAIKKSRGLMSKEFQRIKERTDVEKQLREFVGESLPRAIQYLQRLIDLRSVCLRSNFFETHELIGSSLLFIHDANKASLWMIDFGKTRPLPSNIRISHSKAWQRGSHEDGYLIGLENLISFFQTMVDQLKNSGSFK